MSDELVALKVLIVSDSASERDVLRDAASKSSVVIRVAEIECAGEASPVCAAVSGDSVDVVLLDDRMPPAGRQAVIDAANASKARPLVISVGALDSNFAAEGIAVDGLIAKPIEPGEVRTLFGACLRARLPSRVLVVDDSPTVRSVIRKVLQSCRHRFEVEEAGDGVSALEKSNKRRFDLVLMDCNVPVLDGFTTLAMFRHSQPDAKVVMVTATNDSKMADRARASGAYEVLYKPFYAKDIDLMMNRLYGLMPAKPR